MRYYTAEYQGSEKLLVSFDGGENLYFLEKLGFPFADMNELICTMTEQQTRSLRAMAEAPAPEARAEWEKVKILAPIVRPRQDVLCLGINYYAHAVEAANFSAEAFEKTRPDTIYFAKRVSRATAPGEEIPSYPGLVDGLDYEVELGVILSKDTKNIAEEEALEHVFGYTIINDVSARNLQTRHKQWYLGKSLDGFTPMGPCIVTPDEMGDIKDLGIRCYVNGQERQNGNTGAMMQTVAGAITEFSRGITLQAGTIIATGTPAGVGMGMTPPGFLKKGDVVRCEIDHIGILENTIGE